MVPVSLIRGENFVNSIALIVISIALIVISIDQYLLSRTHGADISVPFGMTRSSFDLGFFLIARETPALSYGGSLDICTHLEKKLRPFGKKVFTKNVRIPGNPVST